jgi:hypothetical protein
MSNEEFCGHDRSKPRTIFHINATEAYSISHLSNFGEAEAEVLFRPLSKFKVLLATKQCDHTLQHDSTGGFPDTVVSI